MMRPEATAEPHFANFGLEMMYIYVYIYIYIYTPKIWLVVSTHLKKY